MNLELADRIIDGAISEGRRLGLGRLTVAVLDAGGHLIALKREDGSEFLRPSIAVGKAWGQRWTRAQGPTRLGTSRRGANGFQTQEG